MTMFDTCGPTQTPDDIDIDALREKYSQERDKRLRPEGSDAVPGTEGRVRGVRRGRSVHAGDASHADRRGRRGGGTRRRHRRTARRRVPQKGRRRRRARHRDGRRLRRCLVLEPVPRNPVRQRCILLHPDARRARLSCRRRSTPTAPRSSSTAATSANTSGCTTARSSPPRCGKCAGTNRSRRWRLTYQPRRRHPGPLRGDDAGLLQPAEAAGHPGHQGLQGPHVPFGPLGLRLHRRRRQRWPAQAARQAGRTGRNRCDGRAAGSAPRPRCPAPLRLSAHALVGGRARQRADGPAVGGVVAARLAGGAQAQLPPLVAVRRRCGFRRDGPGLRLLDGNRPQPDRPGRRQLAIRHRWASSRSWRSREEEDYKVMERLRRRVEAVVDDPQTAEVLKPYYRFLCKRPCSAARSTCRRSTDPT